MFSRRVVSPLICFFLLFLFLITPAGALSSLATNPIKNELTNWNFEDGAAGAAPTGWASTGAGAVISTDYAATGTKSVKIIGDSGLSHEVYFTDSLHPAGTYKAGVWVYPVGFTTGNIVIFLFETTHGATLTYSVTPSQVTNNQWNFIETPTLPVDVNHGVQTKFYLLDATGATVYFDGAVSGSQMTPTYTATESYLNNHALHTFYWVSTGNYNNNPACYVWEYSTINITDPNHSNIGLATGQIDGGAMSSTRINSMVYNDQLSIAFTAGTTYCFYEQIKLNDPLTYTSPAAGATTTSMYPPLFHDQLFEWQATPKSQIEIATVTDAYFENVVARIDSTTGSATIKLKAGTYYWHVRNYDSIQGTWGDWSSSRTFTMAAPAYPPTGSGVHGIVYDADDPLNPTVISGAMVTIYNNTWSTVTYTTVDGYFQVPTYAGNYYITIAKNGYDSYSNYPFSVTGGAYTAVDVGLKKSLDYFPPHTVKFRFKEHWYSFSGLEGVTYAVYVGDGATAIQSGVSGSDGSFVVDDMNQGTKYRIVGTWGTETVTEYIYPSGSSYVITFDNSVSTLISASFFYDTVNVTVTNPSYNATAGYANLTWISHDLLVTQVKYDLYSVGSQGARTLSQTYTETVSSSSTGGHSFIIPDSMGEEFVLVATFSHPSFGTVEKEYVVQYPGSNLPIDNKLLGYLGVIIVAVIGMMWGGAEAHRGAVLMVGAGWFLYSLGIFQSFGSTVTTTMLIGLGLATAYVILNVFVKSKTEQGL